MRLKKGVSARGLTPQIALALMVADEVYREEGVECVITSLNDGKHSRTSLHYCGQGADLRTRNLPNQAAKERVQFKIAERLGSDDYDVILESDHIHVEWQPKSASA